MAGTASTVVAVSSEALVGFRPGSYEARDAERSWLTCSITCAAKGLRIVYEPSWRVPGARRVFAAAGTRGPGRWAQRDEATPTRVLVVTGTVPGTLVGPEGLIEIVEAVAQSSGHTRHAGLRRRV